MPFGSIGQGDAARAPACSRRVLLGRAALVFGGSIAGAPTTIAQENLSMAEDQALSPIPEAALLRNLRAANAVAREALAAGNHPFGAVLVAPDHKTVVLRQGNLDSVRHAESTLALRAAEAIPAEELWRYTLYSTVEPCAMCAGTQYWANIGTLVYGLSEKQLLAMTGNHEENPTLDLPSRDVFARGQKPVRVIGPVDAVAEEITALHKDFWKQP